MPTPKQKEEAIVLLVTDNLSQRDIARKYGVTSEAVRKWMNYYLRPWQIRVWKDKRHRVVLERQKAASRKKSLKYYKENRERLTASIRERYLNDQDYREKKLAYWRKRYHEIHKHDPENIFGRTGQNQKSMPL